MLSSYHLDFFSVVNENKSLRLKFIFSGYFEYKLPILVFITCTGNKFPIMQCCLEKSTIASSMDKNPQERIGIGLQRPYNSRFF